MKASTAIEVRRPVEEVFAFVSDVQNMDRWVTGVSEPHRTSEGEFGIGSTLASKYTYGGSTHDVEYEVTAFDPPTRYDMASREGPFPFEGSVELTSIDEGATLVRNTIDAGADGIATKVIFAVGGPILRYTMRKRLHGELEELKETLESDEFDS